MQMEKVSWVMRHYNEPALLTLNYPHRIDCLYVDNDCMTILNGLISWIQLNMKNEWVMCYLIFRGTLTSLKIFEWVVDCSPLIQKVIVCTFWILILNDDTNISHKTWIPIGIDCWCLNIKKMWIELIFWLRQWMALWLTLLKILILISYHITCYIRH